MGKGDGNVKWAEGGEIIEKMGRFSADIKTCTDKAS